MTSAPASSASRAFSPSANTATRCSRPVPCGSEIVPRSCCSACRTLRPRLKCTSTVSSNFGPGSALTRRTASAGEYTRSRSISERALRYVLPCPLIYPNDRTSVFIKRVIGLPGDRIDIDGPRLRVNGKDVASDGGDGENTTTTFPPGLRLATERGDRGDYQVLWPVEE